MCLHVCTHPVFIAQPSECCGSHPRAAPVQGLLALLSCHLAQEDFELAQSLVPFPLCPSGPGWWQGLNRSELEDKWLLADPCCLPGLGW